MLKYYLTLNLCILVLYLQHGCSDTAWAMDRLKLVARRFVKLSPLFGMTYYDHMYKIM